MVEEKFGKERWPDLTLEQLKNGHQVFINNCGNCHKLFSPEDLTEQAWGKVLPDMARRAKITRDQYDQLSRYIFTIRDSKTKK